MSDRGVLSDIKNHISVSRVYPIGRIQSIDIVQQKEKYDEEAGGGRDKSIAR
ncbi:MAG: hypothetical protein IJE49_05370 [Agathobacter sp.]|nr:hypothetical protein [Agathobacter sp.]